MKMLILISLFTFSLASFAQTSANSVEKALLCNAVDKLLEAEQADMALDLKNCLNIKAISSGMVPGGAQRVKGYLVFRAPGRPSFKMVCELDYVGTPEYKNIIGGLSEGVICTIP